MATALKVHLKNINGDQLHPYTTNVPIGQQFSFSEDKLQLNYDIVRSNLGISSDSLSFSLPKQIFTSATDNQLILSGLPVGIKTNKGNYYPAQKTTVTITGTDIILNLQSYLAYDNSSEFSGAWTVYYASGRDGLDGIDGTGLDIRNQYDSNTVYSKTETSMDAVQYNGSLWGYINATAGSGNPPPETSATASNDYWTLLVAKGEDGTDGVTPAIDPETKHWIIGEEDTGVLAEAKVEGGTATFSSVSENNIATLTGTSVPVGIMTNSGNYYPIEKGSVIINVSEGNIQLDVSPYLAYDNSASFSGTWTVYFAVGKQGEQGNNALSFQIGTVTTLPAGSDATVTATVSEEGLVTLNMGIPQGEQGPQGATGPRGQNGNDGISAWVGTQEEYNSLTSYDSNKLYLISEE